MSTFLNHFKMNAPILGKKLSSLPCHIESALGIAIFLVIRGYNGLGDDHQQYLLPFFKYSVSDFAVGDWFTYRTTAFHLVFEGFIRLFHSFETLEWALFAWHLFTLYLLSLIVQKLTNWLYADHSPPSYTLLTIYLLLSLLSFDFWGAYFLIGDHALPAYLFYPLALTSLYFSMIGSFVMASLFLGIATLVHGGAGIVLGFMVLSVLCARTLGNTIKSFLFWISVYIAILLLLQALQSYGGLFWPMSIDQARIFFLGRAPHHFAPQFFTLNCHLSTGLFLIVYFKTVTEFLDGKVRQIFITLGLSFCFQCFVAFIAIVLWEWPLPVLLFPYRFFPIFFTYLVILLCNRLTCSWHEGSIKKMLPAVTYLTSLIAGFLNPWFGFFFLAVGLLLVRLSSQGQWPFLRKIVLAFPVALLPVACVKGMQRAPFRLGWNDPQLEQLGRQIEERTTVGTVVLTPPYLEGIRIASRRAIVVDFKCIPVKNTEIDEWAARMSAVTGIDPKLSPFWLRSKLDGPLEAYSEGFLNREPSALLDSMTKYDVGAVLAPIESALDLHLRDNLNFRLLGQFNEYRLYEKVT